jgi:protein phosphatase
VIVQIPDPCLLVLCGPAGAGKSTWARRHFAGTEVVSSDGLRAMICDDPGDQTVNEPTFELLHRLVAERLQRLRLTVVDATNLEARARLPLLRLARKAGVPAVLAVFEADEQTCRTRDRRRDRSVGPEVVGEHLLLLAGLDRLLQKERWDLVHRLDGHLVGSARVERIAIPPDRRDEDGPFDVVGDVHGCLNELHQLLERLDYAPDGSHPVGRRLVFVGDLVDRGPDSVGVLRLVLRMVQEGRAFAVPGNHDHKFGRWLRGHDVDMRGGLSGTAKQWERLPDSEQRELERAFSVGLGKAPTYLWLDGGSLLVSHAGLEESLHGRMGRKVDAFCLFGMTTGQLIGGVPERLDWASDYSGSPAVVHGHLPVREALWRNRTANVDLGCVFGGELCAVRWPEGSFVRVPAGRSWWPPDGGRRTLPHPEDIPKP